VLQTGGNFHEIVERSVHDRLRADEHHRHHHHDRRHHRRRRGHATQDERKAFATARHPPEISRYRVKYVAPPLACSTPTPHALLTRATALAAPRRARETPDSPTRRPAPVQRAPWRRRAP